MPLLDNQQLDARFADQGTGTRPRGVSDTILQRAALLPADERTLLRLIWRGDVSRREIAQVLKIPPGTLSRRLRRVGARLYDPLVGALLDPRCPLPPEHRQLGVEHFLQARGVEDLADRHRISPHQVRKMLDFVRGWHKGIREMTKPETRNPNE